MMLKPLGCKVQSLQQRSKPGFSFIPRGFWGGFGPAPSSSPTPRAGSRGPMEPIHDAARRGDVAGVQAALQAGVNPDLWIWPPPGPAFHSHGLAPHQPGCLNDAPCPPFPSQGASIIVLIDPHQPLAWGADSAAGGVGGSAGSSGPVPATVRPRTQPSRSAWPLHF
jgi:hypothetical protein